MKPQQGIELEQLDQQNQFNKSQKVKPMSQADLRVLQFLNSMRNKDSIDPHIMNKQINKARRKEDSYLGDREIEIFEHLYGDFGFGEMVMSFPNPDYEKNIAAGITLKEALQLYDSSLNVLDSSVSTQDREQQRKSFMISFLALEDYILNTEEAQEALDKKNEENEKKRKLKLKEQQKQKEQEKQQQLENQKKKQKQKENEEANNLDPNNKYAEKGSDDHPSVDLGIDNKESKALLIGIEHNQSVSPQPQPLQIKSKQDKNAEIFELFVELAWAENLEAPIIGNSLGVHPKAQESEVPQKEDKKNKSSFQENPQPDLLQTNQNDTTNLLKSGTKFEEQFNLLDTVKKPENTPKQQAMGSIASEKHHTAQSQTILTSIIMELSNNDLSSFFNIRKKLNKGKYMYKRKYDQDDFDWVITNHVPKDFQTLFRNTVVFKLSQNGKLGTRLHLGRGGEQIILSVKAPEEVIKITAAKLKFNKQIELGYADILSLEPCDDKFRPLRLKYVLRLAVKNAKKKREIGLDEKSKKQKNGVLPISNLKEYLNEDEDKFWANLGRKQLYFDGVLNDISNEIKINKDSELIEIIDDNDPLNKKIWAAYSLYLDYLIFYSAKMKVLKEFAENQVKAESIKASSTNEGPEKKKNKQKVINPYKKSAAFLYRLIFKQSIEDTNFYFNKVQSIFSNESLKNIWHRLDVDSPIPPFSEFSLSSNEEHLLFWRTFETNEFKVRSLFTNMEKIKICDIVVNNQVNTLMMLSQETITNYFPLHEPHQLFGEQKLSYFQKLIENEYVPEPDLTDTQERIRKMFLMLDNQADSADFDSESLVKELSIRLFKPWKLSIDSLRDYFGEKIALYFNFLSCYTYHLSYMSLLGIIIEIIIASTKLNHPQVAAGFRYFFGIVITIWQVGFIEAWKRQQAVFALTYGQENFQQQEQERPSFQGTYKRSVFNDQLNEKFYPEYKRKIFIFLSLIMSLIVVCIVVGIIIGLFVLKAYMLENEILIGAPFINPNTLIGILNSIQIIFFNILYMSMNNWMSEIENHQILQSYENSYVSKVFMFTFCNTFNSCFFISFFNDYIKIEKDDYTYLNFCKSTESEVEDCFGVLRTQIISIFIINIIKNIPELLVPILKIVAKKTLKKLPDTLIMHPFREIDIYINNQFDLEPYVTNREIDGTVSDYMELIIQFSFLCLFGLAFPVSFLLAFVNNVIEIQVDKLKLIYVSRRPLPVGAANVGTWFLILEIVSFISIFTISGLIAFTSDTVSSNPHYQEEDYYKYQKRFFFVTFLVLLSLKYVTSSLIKDIPTKVQIIRKRHKNCINSLLNGMSDTTAKSIVSSTPSIFIDQVQYPTQQSDDMIADMLLKVSTAVAASLQTKLMHQTQRVAVLQEEERKKKKVKKQVQPVSSQKEKKD